MMEENLVAIGVFKMADAEIIRTELREKEIEVVMYHNEQTCTTGCATTVELHVGRDNVQQVVVYFEDKQNKRLDGYEFDRALLDEVYDPSQETARCPACGTVFATKHTSCTDCGLVLG
jgi:hypothetical protein